MNIWFNADPPIVPNDTSGTINVCYGDTVLLIPQVDIVGDPTNGSISAIGWSITGQPYTTGDSLVFIASEHTGHFVNVFVIDTLGCVGQARTQIQVSTLPDLNGTWIADTACFGETLFGYGNVTATDTSYTQAYSNLILDEIISGVTYIPDDNGLNAEITMTVTGYAPNEQIQGPMDLGVCITMEHSYLGDLEMMLTCPNGTELVIFNSWTGQGISPAFAGGFGGGGTYLGNAQDGGLGTPGVGWEYCFSESAFWGTLGEAFAWGNTVTAPISGGNAMTPGTYQPEQTYSDLIGCPINGDWTITIRDNIGIDDGYVFEWGIDFYPQGGSQTETYQSEIVNTWWSIDQSIVNIIGDTVIEVLPPPGDHAYTFNMTDDFGCSYDTTVEVNIVPPLNDFTDTLLCTDQYALLAADSEIQGLWTYTPPAGGNASFIPNNEVYNPLVEITQNGEYEFVFESLYCNQTDTVNLFFGSPTSSNTVISECTSYTWNSTNYTQSGNYTFQTTNASGCDSLATLDLTIYPNQLENDFYPLCAGESITVNGATYDQTGQYTQFLSGINGCDTVLTITVQIENEPSISILGNTNIAPNTPEFYAIVDPGGYNIEWSAVNGTVISGQGTAAANIFWDATGGGEVTVTLSNGNCTYTYTIQVGTFVSIETHWVNDLQIHPNPSTGLFNIELTEQTQITMLDARGRKIMETTSNGRFTLDLSAYPTGTYTLQLRTETGVGVKRLVKY